MVRAYLIIILSLFPSSFALADVRLECVAVSGSTATNSLEVIISATRVCMGDGSMFPQCARVDGSLEDWERTSGVFQEVVISENAYVFSNYGGFVDEKKTVPLMWKLTRLNRNTGKALVQYFDDNQKLDYVAMFSCRKVSSEQLF